MVKWLSTMQETQVRSLAWEDPLEKEMAIHSSILAWKVPWMEEPGKLEPMGSQRVGHDWATSLSFFLSFMYITTGKIDGQRKFDSWSRVPKVGALGQPRGTGWGGRWHRFSMGGTHVYPWLIHVDVWQKPSQYCKVIILQVKEINKKINLLICKKRKKPATWIKNGQMTIIDIFPKKTYRWPTSTWKDGQCC